MNINSVLYGLEKVTHLAVGRPYKTRNVIKIFTFVGKFIMT